MAAHIDDESKDGEPTPGSARSLPARVALWVAVGALFPVVTLVLLVVQTDLHARRAAQSEQLVRDNQHVARQIEDFLQHHVAAIEVLADGISTRGGPADAPHAARALARLRAAFPGFVTLIVADDAGRVTRGVPEAQFVERAEPWSIADRDYFHSAMAGRTYLSPVFIGRGFGQYPIVAISAPVVVDGRIVGVVEGSLDLGRFAHFDGFGAERAAQGGIIVLDATGHVVYATAGARYPVTSAAFEHPALRRLQSQPVSTVIDLAGSGIDSCLLVRAKTPQDWQVISYRHADLRGNALRQYALTGVLLFVAICASLGIAYAAARLVTGALSSLIADVEAFDIHRPPAARPYRGATREVRRLYEAINRVGERLRSSYGELNESLAESQRLQHQLEHVVAERDREIEERTAELRERTRELEQANGVLNRVALEDALTGVANRRAFDELMDLIWRLGARERRTVGVLGVDVDHFKQYNDSLGHQAGDDCLRRVAQTLRGFARRPLDLCARVGGEEFALVLADVDGDALVMLAERVRDAIAQLQIPHPQGIDGRVSVSVGLALTVPGRHNRPLQLLNAADRSLYEAKNAGRNRVGSLSDDSSA